MELTIGIVGVLLGVGVTIWVGRYYYLRTVAKSLSVFELLNANVFAGISRDMRKNLHFIFQDKEVDELRQVMLLVANDGERAISNIIEPLSIALPQKVDVLDASILHRHPDELRVSVEIKDNDGSNSLDFDFPLLNKGEFFVVKLLLSGKVNVRGFSFSILADDLPRTIAMRKAPPASLQDAKYRFDKVLAVSGFFVFLLPVWAAYLLYLLWLKSVELFPYPWDSFSPSFSSAFILSFGVIFIGFFLLMAIMMLLASIFDGQFPPSKGPRFPLPKEIKDMCFPYRMPRFSVTSED